MSRDEKLDPLAIISKLAAAEQELKCKVFLAPVLKNARVRVRIAGIVCELAIQTDFAGWGLLRAINHGQAEFVEPASPTLVGKYLSLFPRVQMVLVQQFGGQWWAVAASTSDTRLSLSAPVPVHLVGVAHSFDTVNTRFDGSAFWFEDVDRRRDPAVAGCLRKALAEVTKPEELRCPGAVPQEKLAYKMLWLAKVGDVQAAVDSDQARISTALQHAGAQLESFWHHDGGESTVRFTVDGNTHSVTIRTNDLSVMSAGICLSGRDGDFDLTSLVSVFREYGADGY